MPPSLYIVNKTSDRVKCIYVALNLKNVQQKPRVVADNRAIRPSGRMDQQTDKATERLTETICSIMLLVWKTTLRVIYQYLTNISLYSFVGVISPGVRRCCVGLKALWCQFYDNQILTSASEVYPHMENLVTRLNTNCPNMVTAITEVEAVRYPKTQWEMLRQQRRKFFASKENETEGEKYIILFMYEHV